MSIDEWVFQFFFSFAHRTNVLDGVIIVGAQMLAYGIVLFFLWFLFRSSALHVRLGVFLETLLSILLARGIVTELIRFFFPHLRPWRALFLNPLITGEFSSSFPSGHAVFLFTIATVVFFYNRKWGSLFFVGAFINGIARVCAGVHWPSDILGGLVIAIGCVFVVHWVVGGFIAKLSQASSS